MLTTNTPILRESIDQLERGRRAMMAAPGNSFNWNSMQIPSCGTPGCCWGFTWIAGINKVSHPRDVMWGGFEKWCERLNLIPALRYFFFMLFDETEPYISKCRLRKKGLYPASPSAYFDRELANHRMRLLITRLRHRLAVCEVEQGEWGRQLPAAQMPVGAARKAAVEQRELVTV